jgi:hypothetical protein
MNSLEHSLTMKNLVAVIPENCHDQSVLLFTIFLGGFFGETHKEGGTGCCVV